MERSNATLVMPDKFESYWWFMPIMEKESPKLYGKVRHIKEPISPTSYRAYKFSLRIPPEVLMDLPSPFY